MSVPNINEVDELLNSIAGQMAQVNNALNAIHEKQAPLQEEKSTLRDKIKELDDWLNGEVQYSHAREAEMYEIYLKVKQMWEKFREDSRQLKREREAGMADRVREIDEALWDDRKILRDLENQLASLQRQRDQALRRKKDAENYAGIEQRLGNAIMGAPWREWAKDHQIEGAKRIAYRGKMLLADTMGLGKTLTSICAVDLIREMTKEASEDHPVVIETN